MDWILRHKLIALVIVVVVAVAAWYFLSGSSTAAPPVLAPATAASGSAPAGAQNLVNSLLALKAVSLSGAIFSDPSFQALQDFTTPIEPEPAGRADPFAPLGTVAPLSASSTKAAQLFAPKK